MAVPKVRPVADLKWTEGNDGRDGHHYIQYSCPTCRKLIRSDDIACTECGTFFDWSQHASYRMVPTIYWH